MRVWNQNKIILSFYQSFPPASGAATVCYNVFKFLSGPKYLIQLANKLNVTSPDYGSHIIHISGLPKDKILKGFWLISRFPSILGKIRQLRPSVIIMEGSAWSFYYLILFYLLRFLDIKARTVYHAHNVEYLLRKTKNNFLIAQISKWAEGLLLKRADLSLAVSHVDADVFQGLYGVKPKILPNGVDLERFGNIPDNLVIDIEKKYSLTHPMILFMGLLGFKPNDEALQFLVEEILPDVIVKFPDLKLAVIGGRCPIKRDWLTNPGSIPFEEVPILIRSADICLAPIFSGSGTKLKVLEYLASGKAVIATPKAIEGIDVADRRDLLVARNSTEFVENILFLLKNPDYCRRLGEQGKKKIALHYSWDAVIRNLDHQLDELMMES